MSEETQDQNDGTWSGLKKTLIGTLTTVIAGGGIWVSTTLFGGGHEDKEETKKKKEDLKKLDKEWKKKLKTGDID